MDGRDGRVGVVVITRDRWPDLEGALDHVVALPEAPPVVVVDNGSADGTPVKVRERFGDRIRVLALGRNDGAAARTAGVRALDTPYVAFNDDDSWWAPSMLARAADLLDEHPDLGLLAARVLNGPEAEEDPTCALMADSPLIGRPGLPGPRVLGFIACGAIVRRDAYLAVGGFGRGLGVGGEEQLLAVDLAALGWELAYVDALVAHHHPSAVRDREDRRITALRNDLWFAWRRRAPVAAAEQTAELVVAARRGDAAARRALLRALRGVPRILRDRRPVPSGLERELQALA